MQILNDEDSALGKKRKIQHEGLDDVAGLMRSIVDHDVELAGQLQDTLLGLRITRIADNDADARIVIG